MALSEEMELIKKSLTCATYNGAQHTDIKIIEPAENSDLRNVTLEYISGDWISFDPDRGRCAKKRMSALLTADDKHNHHRACDCVALINNKNDLTVIYIDMKSGNPKGYANQFKSTRQFVQYLVGLTNEFHDKSLKIAKEKYVVLWGGKQANMQKMPTIPQRKEDEGNLPDRPQKFAMLNGSQTFLKKFL